MSTATTLITPIMAILNLKDAPTVEGFKAEGVIGQITLKPSDRTETVTVNVPLTYTNPQGYTKTFNARIFTLAKWFTPEYKARVIELRSKSNEGSIDPLERSELGYYNASFMGKVLPLFVAAKVDGIGDWDALADVTVGFRVKARSDNPTELEIAGFYPVRR